MLASDVKPKSKVWYLYRSLGDGMTYQKQVEVLEVRGERAKIRPEIGKPVWVKVKNLRPTA